MDYITSNNATVDQISKMNFTGNIIPSNWFNTIVNSKGKPNLRAINFLSDIIYWYRASEERDPATGKLIGIKKKFKGDALQRSYSQLAEQFNCTKRDAMATVKFLEELGAIKKDLRTITVNGIKLNNVLFISPIPEKIEMLTYANLSTSVPGHTKKCTSLVHNDVITDTDNCMTNTDISTKNSSEIINPSINFNDNGLIEVDSSDSIAQNLSEKYYEHNSDSVSKILENLIFPFSTNYECYRNEISHDVFDNMIHIPQLLTDMIFESKAKVYNGSSVLNGSKVMEKILSVVKNDEWHNLHSFAIRASSNFLSANANNNFKNPVAYFKSVLWTSLNTYVFENKTYFNSCYLSGGLLEFK